MSIIDYVNPRCGIAAHRMNTIIFMQSSHAVSAHTHEAPELTQRTAS